MGILPDAIIRSNTCPFRQILCCWGAVPGEYLWSAIDCDRTWNGTLPGSVGALEAYMRPLPHVIRLAFGGFGEWSKEVDTLIGQLAEIASEVPGRLGCWHGPTQARRDPTLNYPP